eukprot:1872860-Rhodomonas_salina.1
MGPGDSDTPTASRPRLIHDVTRSRGRCRLGVPQPTLERLWALRSSTGRGEVVGEAAAREGVCLLYTSDAADDM